MNIEKRYKHGELSADVAKDKNEKLVFLSDSSFSLEMTKQKFPSVKFHYKSEF